MTLIVYGENEIFESNAGSIPDAIVELYEHCGGRMEKELFCKVIMGMVPYSIQDQVDVFEHMVSAGRHIVKIYVGADRWFDADGYEDGK